MPTYRIYTFDEGAHILEPPKVIECENDEAAVKEAKQLLNGKLIEVWEKARHMFASTPLIADPKRHVRFVPVSGHFRTRKRFLLRLDN